MPQHIIFAFHFIFTGNPLDAVTLVQLAAGWAVRRSNAG